MSALSIAVIAIVSIGAILAFVGWKAWQAKQANDKWRPIGDTGLRYLPSPNVDPGALELATRRAIAALTVHSPWSHEKVLAGLKNWGVIVRASPIWIADDGRSVAGLTLIEFGAVEVGSDLAALTHELAHVLEWTIDGLTDLEHAGWYDRGLYAAVAAADGTNGVSH